MILWQLVVCIYSAGEDDVYDVNDEVFSISRKWMYLARWFKLPHSTVSRIGRKHDCNPDNCLFDVLQEWLGTAKDDQRHGHPSWQVLVKAVAHPAGGNNRALAEAIAQKYSGIY